MERLFTGNKYEVLSTAELYSRISGFIQTHPNSIASIHPAATNEGGELGMIQLSPDKQKDVDGYRDFAFALFYNPIKGKSVAGHFSGGGTEAGEQREYMFNISQEGRANLTAVHFYDNDEEEVFEYENITSDNETFENLAGIVTKWMELHTAG